MVSCRTAISASILRHSVCSIVICGSAVRVANGVTISSGLLITAGGVVRLSIESLGNLLSRPRIALKKGRFPFRQVRGGLVTRLRFPRRVGRKSVMSFSVSLGLGKARSLVFCPFTGRAAADVASSCPRPDFRKSFSPRSERMGGGNFGTG